MFYDLKVEMVDIVRPYEWNFAICAMRVDEKNETRKISMFQRMIERYSYLFLMDAWEPQLLANTKTSFVFCDSEIFDMFVDTMQDAKLHNRMADRLIETREAAGITQEKLAEKVGLQSNSIHRYEAAERKMNLFTAVKMADVLNTTVERLVPEEYIHKTEKTDIEREAEDVFHQLSPEEQKMLLRQMKGLLAVPA